MGEIKIFESPQFGSVRTLTEDGMTLFCGSDVAKALGYKNPHKALADHCRWVTKREVPHPQSASKKARMNFIPEGDIYRLAAKSELPGAEEFEQWIFDEVLPAIRLSGSYTISAGGEADLMQALVKIEQRQKSQDYAMQNIAYRMAILEKPAELTAIADAIREASDALKSAMEDFRTAAEHPIPLSTPKPASDTLWYTRCRGILFRVSRKAKKKQDELEREMWLEAARRAGVHLDSCRGPRTEAAGNAVLRDAFIRLANELAELYGV